MTGTPKSQRRTLLKAAGALTGIGVLGRMVGAENANDAAQTTYQTGTGGTSNPTGTQTTNGSDGGGNQGNKRNIILGARVGYWLGLEPRQIQGSRNPTLGFLPTQRYTVTWINLDGNRHEFQIIGQKNGENGQVLYRTGVSSARGATRTLTFKPTDRIRRYRCRFHPDSMRGDINRTGQFGGGGGTFTTGTSGGTNTAGGTAQGTFTTGGRTTGGGGNTRTTGGGTFTTGTSGGTNTTQTTGGTFTTETTRR